MKILLTLIKQDIRNLLTNPVLVLFSFIYPIFLILIFGFLFSNNYGAQPVTSYDFYGITMMFYIILVSATITPSVFMEERIKMANLRVAYSPVTRIQLYGSKLLSSFFFLGIAFTIQIFLLHFLGIVNFGGNRIIAVYILYMILLLFSTTLGGAVCVLIRNEDLTNKILGVIINTIAVIVGIFFPIASLGSWAEQISNWVPVRWLLNLIFQIIYDGTYHSYGFIIMTLVSLALVFIAIIHFKYKPEDYV